MLNLLGLAARAKKLTYGAELTIKGVRNNRVKLVFLANDTKFNTTKFVEDKSKTYNVLIIKDYNSVELSNAVGKNNIKVIGVVDQGFSNSMLNQKRK